MKNTKYICRDASGWALQFTSRGHSVQCSAIDADRFNSHKEAATALIVAGELGGEIDVIAFASGEHPDATDGDSVETILNHG